MSGTVTGLDLDRLEELAEKATPGPWQPGQYIFDGSAAMIFAPELPAPEGSASRSTVVAATERSTHPGATWDSEHTYGNAEFIAAMRNAVPSLLAAYRAVQRVEALIAPVARTTAHEALETSSPAYFLAMSQFAGQVRAALGTEQEGRAE